MMKGPSTPTLGILVGGGPAPGINGVIHAATITAINNGMQVLGIYDGFKSLMAGKITATRLTIEDVSRIHKQGGSILRTARANPTKSEADLRACVNALLEAGVTALVGIGGDDTAHSVRRVTEQAQKMGIDIRSVHVPKTIDNDLPLPEGIPTFGYETARELATRLTMNMMEDARTNPGWFLVVSMGRQAGHLALGIGKSAGATLTVIAEEWRGQPIRMQHVIDILATAIIRRLAEGRGHGVAIIAEGIVEQLHKDDLKELDGAEIDEHGHIRLAEINFSDILKKRVAETLGQVGVKMRLVDKELGYELRCADPVAYDIDYTLSLGQGAVEHLLAGGSGATITIQNNQVQPVPYDEYVDPKTGRTRVRMVNVDSFSYQSASKLMIR
ncbi:MAG: ATP-dependent phosphofructokinase / diphosphate-dependent phosphofructokinase, partial [Chloroflexota bacterium]|nr:ATP-dependent phosphofructokinase / diphosphate-dependent phosphofructokinase [Chloroflexota bacterium]